MTSDSEENDAPLTVNADSDHTNNDGEAPELVDNETSSPPRDDNSAPMEASPSPTLEPEASSNASHDSIQMDAQCENVEEPVSPLYLKMEAKKLFYQKVLPKQRKIMILLTYILVLSNFVSLVGIVLFGHPLTVILGVTQVVSLLFNLFHIFIYHLKGNTEYLKRNITIVVAHSIFNLFAAGIATFVNGIVTTLVIVSQYVDSSPRWSCFIMCIFSLPGNPTVEAWAALAFISNMFVYLSTVLHFGQGYAALMFMVYKESKDLVEAFAVEKNGIPSIDVKRTQKIRGRAIRIQRISFIFNIALFMSQVMATGFTIGMFFLLIDWGENVALIIFYLLIGILNVGFTFLSSGSGVVLRFFYTRPASVANLALQSFACITSLSYCILVFIALDAKKHDLSDFTSMVIGAYGVANIAKCLLTILSFIFTLGVVVIRIRMPYIAKLSYFSNPKWKRQKAEKSIYGGKVKSAPQYSDLMYEEYHKAMERTQNEASKDENYVIEHDTIDLNVKTDDLIQEKEEHSETEPE